MKEPEIKLSKTQQYIENLMHGLVILLLLGLFLKVLVI
jgi:hypothetical protein